MFEKALLKIVRPWLRRNMFSEDEIVASSAAAVDIKKRVFWFFWRMMRDPILEYQRLRYNLICSLPDRDAMRYAEELRFLQLTNGRAPKFPYPQIAGLDDDGKVISGVEDGLPFVVHCGHRLFFPNAYSLREAERLYQYYVQTEGILGSGFLLKSPHAYVTSDFTVEEGDVLLDVGCSEGLFALDNCEQASKVYLFEAQKIWKLANEKTFSPFRDKVRVINRFVGSETRDGMVSLADAVRDESSTARYFIQMDIEGGERAVLSSSAEFLKTHRVKIACAAYHRQDDFDFLSKCLTDMGFEVSASDGYMLPDINGFVYPYFRRGIIYARNF